MFPLKALPISTWAIPRIIGSWDRLRLLLVTPEGVATLVQPGKEMKICTFLWVYYGYPTSSYEGVSVEEMRYNCGSMLAKTGLMSTPDIVAGVPDSGTAHAIGYANEVRNSLFQTLYQVYAYLAPFLYAYHPEPEEPDRQDEADPGT